MPFKQMEQTFERVKHYNNVLGLPFFHVPLDQVSVDVINSGCIQTLYTVQVVPPALHISLGVFYRLFSLLEQECHQLDLQHALLISTAPTVSSYATFAEAMKKVHDVNEQIKQQE